MYQNTFCKKTKQNYVARGSDPSIHIKSGVWSCNKNILTILCIVERMVGRERKDTGYC